MAHRQPEFDPYIDLKSGGKPRIFATIEARRKAYRLYYDDLWTYERIGVEFETSKVVVKNLFKAMGWQARDRSEARRTDGRLSDKAFAKYERLYLAGWTITEIAEKYRFAAKRLSEYLKENGTFIDRTEIARNNVDLSFAFVREEQRRLIEQSPYYGIITKQQFYKAAAYLTYRVGKPLLRVPKFSRNDVGDVADAYYTPRSRPISVFEVAHPVNLEYLPAGRNIGKGSNSSLTARELRLGIKAYNARYGDPFADLIIKSNSPAYANY